MKCKLVRCSLNDNGMCISENTVQCKSIPDQFEDFSRTGEEPEQHKCLSCPNIITDGDYCLQCSDTPDGRQPEVTSKSVQKRLAVQQSTSDERRESFFILFPFHSNAIVFDKQQDCFKGDSATTPIQLIDIWNSRYQIFKSAYTTATQKAHEEIEQWKMDYAKLKEYSEQLEQQIEDMK